MLFKDNKEKKYVALEESLEDDWTKDLDVVEVPIGNKPLLYLGIVISLIGVVLVGRILYLNSYLGKFYEARAQSNANEEQKTLAPRGLIYDRAGRVLADNKATFAAFLDVKEFMRHPELQKDTLRAIENTFFISASDISDLIEENSSADFAASIALNDNLSQGQLVSVKGLNLPTIVVRNDFERSYRDTPVFSSVVGYIGRASAADLKNDPALSGEDFVGRAGVEAFYNNELAGKSGTVVKTRNAKGQILNEREESQPQMGKSLHLTVDSGLQEYFYERLQSGLAALGRNSGVGIALNPQNGEILALINMPSYDNNVLSGSGNKDAKLAILNSKFKPLFSRAVSGSYSPGSTIKPLVGVAALKEGVIDPKTKIFSPGYLDVPNPYDPENPTRFLDWRYQGEVDLAAAIAQSSNVYFYTVGGGANGIKGLGIDQLHDWWQKFNLGKPTGIDLPSEIAGFLPTIQWKEDKTHKPWLLGDTYNVSIGQGDLLVTPIQLLNYISAIANGGKIYQPTLNLNSEHPKTLADLPDLLPQIKEVQNGMRQAVTAQLGTAHLLSDLGFPVAAKTGSAQIQNNVRENALFVGYAPIDRPQVVILVLVENSLEGSLNAVPIAKDVLNWYYWNRIAK
jgi:penicillin-binding protein 2